MTRRPRMMPDPDLIGVSRPAAQGEDFAVSTWRRGPNGVRLEQEFTCQPGALAGEMADRRLSHLVMVLPAGTVICRPTDLPEASDEQLAVALRLHAESFQLGMVPPHRSAQAVLPRVPGTARTGVVLEWPRTDAVPAVPPALVAGRAVGFTGEVAALAALVCVPGVSGPLLAVDRARGVVAVALPAPEGVILRSAREEPSAGFEDAVTRLVAETALHAGIPGSALDAIVERTQAALAAAGPGGLGAAPADLARLSAAFGVQADPSWWRRLGVDAGVALAASGPLAPLTRLLAHEPGEEPDVFGRVLNRLSEPRVLITTAAVAIAAAVFGPVITSWIHLQVVQWKVGDVAAYRKQVEEGERLEAVYRELGKQTWPMTKVLADLACNTPEGIELEQVNVVHNEGVSVRGQAKPNPAAKLSGPEVILLMERQMQESRVFDRIVKGWEPPNQGGVYQFTLSAAVTSPTRQVAYKEDRDYGAKTLKERRYPSARKDDGASGTPKAVEGAGASGESSAVASGEGDGPRPPAPPAPPSGSGRSRGGSNHVADAGDGAAAKPGPASGAGPAAEGDKSKPSVAAPAQGAEGEGDRRGSAEEGRRKAQDRGLAGRGGGDGERHVRGPGAAEAANPVPDPLTPEQVAAMTKEDALQAISKVSKARNDPGVDDAVKERLKKEFDQLMQHIKQLKQGS